MGLHSEVGVLQWLLGITGARSAVLLRQYLLHGQGRSGEGSGEGSGGCPGAVPAVTRKDPSTARVVQAPPPTSWGSAGARAGEIDHQRSEEGLVSKEGRGVA